MQMVIYKSMGIYHITTETNYNSRIQNARAIHKLEALESVPEVINYYCTHFGSQIEDFMVVGSDGSLANWYDLYKAAEESFGAYIYPEIKEMVARHTKGGNENA